MEVKYTSKALCPDDITNDELMYVMKVMELQMVSTLRLINKPNIEVKVNFNKKLGVE